MIRHTLNHQSLEYPSPSISTPIFQDSPYPNTPLPIIQAQGTKNSPKESSQAKLYLNSNQIEAPGNSSRTPPMKANTLQNTLAVFLSLIPNKSTITPHIRNQRNQVREKKLNQNFFSETNPQRKYQQLLQIVKEDVKTLSSHKSSKAYQKDLSLQQESSYNHQFQRSTENCCILLRPSSTSSLRRKDILKQVQHKFKDYGLNQNELEQIGEFLRIFNQDYYQILENPQCKMFLQELKQLQIKKLLISLEKGKLQNLSLFQQQYLKYQNKLIIIQLDTQGQNYTQSCNKINCRPAQFRSNTQNLSSYLNKLTDICKEDHVLALKDFWNQVLQTLKSIKNNWEIYKQQIKQQIQQLIMVLDYKINHFRLNLKAKNRQNLLFCPQNILHLSLYQQIYPEIGQIVCQFLKLLQIHSLQMRLQEFKKRYQHQQEEQICKKFSLNISNFLRIQQNKLDQLLVSYVLQLSLYSKTRGEKELLIEESGFYKPLKKCISQYTGFNNATSQLQDLLSYLKARVNQIKDTEKQVNKHGKNMVNIEFQTLPDTKCLGCSQFFEFNSNILDETINQVPLKVFPSVKKLKDYEVPLKQQICSMLNSGGGAIFFGCQERYKIIRIVGEKITERNKQDCQQILQFMTRSFYPKIEYNKQIQLTFVPVIQQIDSKQIIFQGQKDENEQNSSLGQLFKKQYIEGVYVARIRINPTQNHLTYFWESKSWNQTEYFSTKTQNSQIKMLKGNQFRKALKRRFKQNFLPNQQNLTSVQLQMLTKQQSCFPKPCLLPQIGHKIAETDTFDDWRFQNPEDSFKYMSLMIVKQKHLDSVKQKLKIRKIRFFVEEKFRSYNFRSAVCTYVLYHDICFDQLLNTIFISQDFVFQQKMTVVIYISEYLKFAEAYRPLSDEEMNNSLKWLRNQFPTENIRFYSYKKGNSFQFYAQTSSKMSTLFMYYLFNHNNIKTYLKTPSRFNDLSIQQKSLYWKEIVYSDLYSLNLKQVTQKKLSV